MSVLFENGRGGSNPPPRKNPKRCSPAAAEILSVPVAEIVVGDRAGREAKNVLGLADSIRRLGLLHPIVLNSRREWIAGARRLEAVKVLGWETVPCRVGSGLDDALTARLRAAGKGG